MSSIARKKNNFLRSSSKELKKNYQLILLALPAIVIVIMFLYIPMYGVQIAFRDFVPIKGITGSEWVGFDNFIRFFKSYNFKIVIKNTLIISAYTLVVGFPFPIMLALILNQMNAARFKRVVQTVTYMPYFISMVVLSGMLLLFMSPTSGIIGQVISKYSSNSSNLIGRPNWFSTIYVWSGVWQYTGWGSIIYLAALSGIDPALYDASSIDGASRWQRIIYIDIPCILPTAIILLTLNAGRIMSVGFEKIYLLQNDLNLPSSEIISTYVYKIGLLNAQYDYSAAINLFNSVINFVLLITVNRLAKKMSDTSLW
jgi:putative aldouronate transport system permease protein